jgi:hypothetical protein
VHLSLRDLDIALKPPTGCSVVTQEAVRIKCQGAGKLQFLADNVRLGAPGFYISVMPAGEPLDDDIRITRSSCTSTTQCYDFLQLQIDTQPGEQLALGSQFNVEVSNNLVQDIVLEGITIELSGVLRPEDASRSLVLLRHNTLLSQGDWNYGIAFYEPPSIPVIIANNAISYIAHPLYRADPPQIAQTSNWVSSDASSKAWFENYDAGSFVPSLNSPLIGAGDPDYGTPVDIHGNPRTGHYDVGAYQR